MRRLIGLLLVGVVAAVLLLPAGAPVSVGYVYSDSMVPTLAVDDGYLLVPAGDVAVGDLVSFRSAAHETLVTHRIVGARDGRFLTRGDANPSTDQAGGDPPVAREDVVGRVLTVGGSPLVVPNLGVAVRAIRAHRLPLVGVVLALGLYGGRRAVPRPRSRTLPRAGDAVVALVGAAFLSIAAALFLGTTTTDLAYVALDDVAGPHAVPVGRPSPVTATLRFAALPFTRRVVLVDGLRAVDLQAGAANVTVSGVLPGRPDPGVLRAHVTAARYPAVLPRGVLRALLDVHPLAAATVVAVLLCAPLVLLARLAVDWRRPASRSRSRTHRLLGEVFDRE